MSPTVHAENSVVFPFLVSSVWNQVTRQQLRLSDPATKTELGVYQPNSGSSQEPILAAGGCSSCCNVTLHLGSLRFKPKVQWCHHGSQRLGREPQLLPREMSCHSETNIFASNSLIIQIKSSVWKARLNMRRRILGRNPHCRQCVETK